MGRNEIGNFTSALHIGLGAVMREAELEDFGVRSGDRRLVDMRYADDTLLISDGRKNPSDAVRM